MINQLLTWYKKLIIKDTAAAFVKSASVCTFDFCFQTKSSFVILSIQELTCIALKKIVFKQFFNFI